MENQPASLPLSYWNKYRTGKPLIELVELKKNIEKRGIIETNEIIFILEGKCYVHSDIHKELILEEKTGIFLPGNCHYNLSAIKNTHILIVQLNLFQKLPGCYSMDELYEEVKLLATEKEFIILSINEPLEKYLEILQNYLQDGLNTPLLCDLKTKELLFILSKYYSKDILALFFKPVLNSDLTFASFVLENWKQVKTAKEFANLSSYCETGFNKKFKKVFGVSPYKWLNERRASLIYYELCTSNKPFKIIAEEFLFKSQQHFNDYCIRYFKKTPGSIRKISTK